MSGLPTATMTCPVAAFDFDGTLLDGDCLLILHRLVRSPLGRVIDGVQLPALALKSGLRSTAWSGRCSRVLLAPAMQALWCSSGKTCCKTFSRALWQRLRPEALACLEWHRQQGHRLVIVGDRPAAYCSQSPSGWRWSLSPPKPAILAAAPRSCRSSNCKGPRRLSALSNGYKDRSAG